eukprot:TRINITY_DN3400_c0_g1_i1.p1 TRINITY_DN3400_c0_g1~~TRINITY_DN3400_c0_g1_i1.p1  ORF type:complete len:108 (+),score=17.19 TRINITY_DN3400_c0_g1_i1:76-399(+)
MCIRDRYHRGPTPRALAVPGIRCVGGFYSHPAKDEAMTQASDVDIAWVRSPEEQKALYGGKYRPRVSGTEKNLLRRQGAGRGGGGKHKQQRPPAKQGGKPKKGNRLQ